MTLSVSVAVQVMADRREKVPEGEVLYVSIRERQVHRIFFYCVVCFAEVAEGCMFVVKTTKYAHLADAIVVCHDFDTL